tara:strand:- start:534 stop:923 length:390 start_codon:yes stop_codon:yes gene_type:complete
MSKKENKSQFNIFNFIIILCFIVSTIFLFQINNDYFKKVCLLLIFNIIIYAFININTKSQKTLLNLTAFYTIYVFFTTVGIFMLTQGNNVIEENQHDLRPDGHHLNRAALYAVDLPPVIEEFDQSDGEN